MVQVSTKGKRAFDACEQKSNGGAEPGPEQRVDATSTPLITRIITAMLEMGAFVGALFAGVVADKYSRKMSIAVGVVWFLGGAALQTTSFSYSQMVVGRTVGGIGIGFLSSTAPMYVSEVGQVSFWCLFSSILKDE